VQGSPMQNGGSEQEFRGMIDVIRFGEANSGNAGVIGGI